MNIAKELVSLLLQVNPRQRLTIRQVLQHPWLVESRTDSGVGLAISIPKTSKLWKVAGEQVLFRPAQSPLDESPGSLLRETFNLTYAAQRRQESWERQQWQKTLQSNDKTNPRIELNITEPSSNLSETQELPFELSLQNASILERRSGKISNDPSS